jgi:hypothetical protein
MGNRKIVFLSTDKIVSSKINAVTTDSRASTGSARANPCRALVGFVKTVKYQVRVG